MKDTNESGKRMSDIPKNQPKDESTHKNVERKYDEKSSQKSAPGRHEEHERKQSNPTKPHQDSSPQRHK